MVPWNDKQRYMNIHQTIRNEEIEMNLFENKNKQSGDHKGTNKKNLA